MPTEFLNTEYCDWQPRPRTLIASSRLFNGRFPAQILVKSHWSGRRILFVPMGPDHPRFDQDQWDGEEAHYVPTEAAAVEELILVGAC